MPTYKEDGYRSALIGNSRRRSFAIEPAEQYARGGIEARVIDVPADVAMSRGVNIDGDDERIIESELERIDLVGNMSEALRWARLDGGSALLLLTDTGMLSDPLPDTIGKLNEINVIELHQLTVAPGGYYNDPTLSSYGQPEFYQVRPANVGGQQSQAYFIVHESRLLPVRGESLPTRMKMSARVPWQGRSAADASFDTISRYRESLRLSMEVLKRKQQAVHKMSGLAELIQNGQEDLVRKRVDLVDDVRSLMNGVAVDAEDDYTVYDQGLSGIRELIGEFQIAVSADSGIPVTSLFGRSSGGLNSTGEGDLEGLYDMCEGIQRTSAQPAIVRLVDAITRQRGINAPDKWSVEWPSLWTPTDAQQADTRLKNAQAMKAEADSRMIDLDTGTVTGDEVRDQLARDGLYGMEIGDGD